jgi:hypothetical protein
LHRRAGKKYLRFRTAKGGFSFIDSPHQEQRS